MSSEQNKPVKEKFSEENQALSDASLGYSSSLRLGLYYFLFFSIITAGLFGISYYSLSQNLHDAELAAVQNKALEYRAWYLNGETEQLKERMNEQSVQDGEILFVRLKGENFDFIQFTSGLGPEIGFEDFRNFDQNLEGTEITLGGQTWTVASVPTGRNNIILQAGKNTRGADATLANFRKTFLLLFIPGSLIAIFSGTFLTFRVLSPIRRLIETMRRIQKSGTAGNRVTIKHQGNELNALCDLFNLLLQRNENLIQGLRETLDHASHDFRTPISRLKMTVERALTNETSEQSLKDALEDCAEEADYLEHLLTVVMNVAEAEAGALTLKREQISAQSLLDDITELYEFVAEDKNIELEIRCPENLHFKADRTRMAQALANLVDNAIKYGRPDSTVTISADTVDQQLILTVKDEGLGIKPDDLPFIWDRLFRADQSRSAPGMGLGLSLVKGIAEAHKGEVHAESEPGIGTTIRLVLPML